MKNILAILLCLGLTLSLAACGGSGTEEAPEEEPTPVTMQAPAPAEEPEAETPEAAPETAQEAPETEEAPEAASALDEEAYAAAQSCIGRSVEELYAAIGEPESSQYAASCLEENADDGMLYYGGFYVWTVRNESSEIIHDVYLSE